MASRILSVTLVLAAAALTACGGAGTPSSSVTLPPDGSGSQNVRALTERSIDLANSLGSPIKNFNDDNESTISPAQPLQLRGRQPMQNQNSVNGTCSNGVEFFAPDKAKQTNSTERVEFYDAACTQTATDTVRIYNPAGNNAETVRQTLTKYAQDDTNPEAVRTETIQYTNAAFDKYGFPIAANGFDRSETGYLDISGSKTIDSDSELSVASVSNSTNAFCGDSAGFNATGNQQLGETFGWAGIASNGTRTVNSDSSVTWSATHNGTAYTGPIGNLSISTGTQNTSCPIGTPMFSLTGGSAKGNYTLPISVTFADGLLTNLTVSNATLANGDTLNVQTNPGTQPGSAGFITGATANSSGSQISTFAVNEFGDGTLTIAATGTTYSIIDWHVVK